MIKIEYNYEIPNSVDFLELFETTGWNDYYKVDQYDLSSILENSWCVVSVSDGKKLVGTGRVVSDGLLHAMIFDMIVSPTHQDKGIGTTILHMLVEKCETAKIRDIQLFSAKGKAPFYRKNGFIERPDDAPGMSFKR